MYVSSPAKLKYGYTSVIHVVGNNYTGSYRDVPQILKTIKSHVPLEIFEDLERILTVDTQNHFNGESSHKNYNKYQKYRNRPTLAKYDNKITKIINKEEPNNGSNASLAIYIQHPSL